MFIEFKLKTFNSPYWLDESKLKNILVPIIIFNCTSRNSLTHIKSLCPFEIQNLSYVQNYHRAQGRVSKYAIGEILPEAAEYFKLRLKKLYIGPFIITERVTMNYMK